MSISKIWKFPLQFVEKDTTDIVCNSDSRYSSGQFDQTWMEYNYIEKSYEQNEFGEMFRKISLFWPHKVPALFLTGVKSQNFLIKSRSRPSYTSGQRMRGLVTIEAELCNIEAWPQEFVKLKKLIFHNTCQDNEASWHANWTKTCTRAANTQL